MIRDGITPHEPEPRSVVPPALFHAQPAAGKALKAYRTWRQQPFQRTHDLTGLLGRCATYDAAFHPLCDAKFAFSPSAVDPRHLRLVPEVFTTEARPALSLAAEVYTFIVGCLPSELAT
jgi:HEPN domain-containing protein